MALGNSDSYRSTCRLFIQIARFAPHRNRPWVHAQPNSQWTSTQAGMAGDGMGMQPPAIFITYTGKPQSTMMMVIVVMMVMVMSLRWSGHCQNGKGCASENHFL
jgi:hypothetical protein